MHCVTGKNKRDILLLLTFLSNDNFTHKYSRNASAAVVFILCAWWFCRYDAALTKSVSLKINAFNALNQKANVLPVSCSASPPHFSNPCHIPLSCLPFTLPLVPTAHLDYPAVCSNAFWPPSTHTDAQNLMWGRIVKRQRSGWIKQWNWWQWWRHPGDSHSWFITPGEHSNTDTDPAHC